MGVQLSTRGDLVARGNTSDVFRWTSATVLKLLRPGIPPEWATQEADITRRAHAAGLPAPAVEGVIEVDGRIGVVFEHIQGISMWDQMKQAPQELPALVQTLVTLQTELHKAGSPEGLPPLVSRVHDKIDTARQLSPEDRELAHDLLRHLPTSTALCHGDMHPANILMSPRGLMVVDWFDAASGHPTADHARSSLLMRPTTAARPDSSFLGGATHELLTRLHRAYRQTLDQRGLDGDGHLATWEAVLAAARLAEPVPPDDFIGIWTAFKAALGPPAVSETADLQD